MVDSSKSKCINKFFRGHEWCRQQEMAFRTRDVCRVQSKRLKINSLIRVEWFKNMKSEMSSIDIYDFRFFQFRGIKISGEWCNDGDVLNVYSIYYILYVYVEIALFKANIFETLTHTHTLSAAISMLIRDQINILFVGLASLSRIWATTCSTNAPINSKSYTDTYMRVAHMQGECRTRYDTAAQWGQ